MNNNDLLPSEYPPDSVIFKEENYSDTYERGLKLGSGGFGVVYEVKEKKTG